VGSTLIWDVWSYLSPHLLNDHDNFTGVSPSITMKISIISMNPGVKMSIPSALEKIKVDFC
jgi:hypothetical protein